jgi:hypothetical protein
MYKAEFDRFIRYYHNYRHQGPYNPIEIISHLYEKFGQEFIFDLPIEYKTDPFNGEKYTLVQGTYWMHSTTGLACYYRGKPGFYILGNCVSLDEWLPYSALTNEECTLFKLKYA